MTCTVQLNNEEPNNGSTIAYNAKLIFQDIVSEEGWSPPENVTELLFEHSVNGGIIHSNSWGDDTTAYTDRTADFDLWAIEMPWSLSFIAPGNTGGQLLEPANGRNVVAIGATEKGHQVPKCGSLHQLARRNLGHMASLR